MDSGCGGVQLALFWILCPGRHVVPLLWRLQTSVARLAYCSYRIGIYCRNKRNGLLPYLTEWFRYRNVATQVAVAYSGNKMRGATCE